MDKTAFETRAISIFHDLKFVFYEELQQGEVLKRIPTSQKAMLVASAFIGTGILGTIGTRPSKFTDEEINTKVAKLATLCDLIGIQISTGVVRLVLFVHNNDLADEAVIGKCHLIRDSLTSFKQFSMRIGWAKYPVYADVFFIFTNSEKAFHFRQSVQEHCKHVEFFKKVYVLPWGIDLSAKSIWGYKGLLPLHNYKPADLEAKLFSQSDAD